MVSIPCCLPGGVRQTTLVLQARRINLHGFWTKDIEKREKTSLVIVRACQECDVVGVGEAHIPRTAVPAVREYAEKNHIRAYIALWPTSAKEEEKLAARAHDFLPFAI